jgi:hypothetical protein
MRVTTTPTRDGEETMTDEHADAGGSRDESKERASLPPVDFETFITSLSASALLHLGAMPLPDGSTQEVNLPMAKHTIDIIALLEEKTRGNLTDAEARTMNTILYDLRLRFIEVCKKTD